MTTNCGLLRPAVAPRQTAPEWYSRIDRLPPTGPSSRRSMRLPPVAQLWEETMRRVLYLLAAGVCASALMTASASAQAAPEVTLTRLDCGTPNPPTDVSL